MRNRLAVLSAVLVFALLVGGLAVFAARSGDGDLPRLPIGATGARDAATAARAAGTGSGFGGDAASESRADMALYPYRWAEYRIGARLPDVGDRAAAYHWTAPTATAVRGLAGRLGMSGQAEHEDGAWTVTDGTRFLRVDERSGQWNLGPDPSTGVSSSATVTKCAPCPPEQMCAEMMCDQPVRPAGMPTQDEALRLARAFWDKAGVDVGQAKVDIDDGFTQWYVRFRPLIGGRPMIGAETSVAIGAKGAVEWANGWTAGPEKVGDYPLLSPRRAVERLNASMTGGVGCGGPMVQCDPGPMPADTPMPGSKPMPADKPSCRSGAPTTMSWPEGTCTEEASPPSTVPSSQGGGGTAGAASDGNAGSPGTTIPGPGQAPPSDMPLVPGAPDSPTLLTITGVRVELLAVGEYVVPVYVFTLDNGGETGPVPAVPDKYLQATAQDQPQPARDTPGVPEPAPR
jgi:hypothetical protein